MACTASKSFVRFVVALACLLGGASSARAQTTTTYGSGGSSNTFTGDTINPGDTVLLNNGATVTGNVTANGTLQFNQTAALTISSTISGTGTLALTNTGTLNLTSASGGRNTVLLDMTTTVSSGLLQIRSASATAILWVGGSSTGTLNVTGGSVQSGASYLGYNAGSLGTATVSSGTWANNSSRDLIVGYSGTGTLTVTGGYVSNGSGYIGRQGGGVGTAMVSSGTWANASNLSVGEQGTGTLNVTGGYVSAGSSGAYLGYNPGGVGTATVSSGTLASAGNLTVGPQGTGTLNVTGGYVNNASGYIGYNVGGVGTANVSSGTWANSGNLTVGSSGTGTLTMSGGLVSVSGTLSKGTYGTINLNSGGTLQIGVGGTTGVLGVSTLTNNGTLIFNRSDDSTYSGIISGTGAVSKLGDGTLTLSGSNGYTGATAVNAGVLSYGASNVLSDSTAVTVAGGGLNLGSYNDTVASFTITSGSLFGSGKLTAATYAIGGGTVASNLGAGSMTVTANSNLNGTTDATSVSLNAGTLTLGSASRFTSNQVALTGTSGGSLSLGGNEAVGSLAGGFNVALGSATLSTGNDNTSTNYSGILSGSGGLTKAGTGTFTLSGSNGYTGATAINAGKMLVNGQLGNTAVAVNAGGLLGGSGRILGNVTVASSGTLAPGNSPGVLTVGSLSLLAGSHTLMEISGTSASLYDQVVGTGTGGLTYGGSLDLVMSGSYANGTTFHLFSNFSSPFIGDFAAVGLSATGEYAGLIFSDSDHVGGVWTSSWTTNHQRLVFTAGTGDLVVVPEPSTYAMVLAGLACGGWQMWRRRRRGLAPTLAA